MEASAIKENDIEALLESLGKLLKKRLKTDGIQMRKREKEMVACLGLNSPIEIQCLVLVLKGSYRLNAFAGNDSSDNRHQAKTTLILGKNLDRALPSVRLLGLAQVLRKRFFLNASSCSGSFLTLLFLGTLGLAFNL